MLYDPKWEVKTKEPSVEGLIAWLETKNPKQKYDYYDCGGEFSPSHLVFQFHRLDLGFL